MSIFRTASRALAAAVKSAASVNVTYIRGAASTLLRAAIGKTTFELTSESGIYEKTESRDFLIVTADLIVGGQLTKPQRNDIISEMVCGVTYQYQVMAPGNEPHYRYVDDYRQLLRIHTKQIVNPDN